MPGPENEQLHTNISEMEKTNLKKKKTEESWIIYSAIMKVWCEGQSSL